ncbi:MAG: glycine-rich domain-containing protein-like [Cyanobacteriota bacterium]
MLTDSILVENPVWEALDQTFSSKLQQLNLRPIQKQLMQFGWTHQQAMRAINRYKMFLSVVYLHPHIPLIPTQEIDFVWHCHILHTRKYRQDCQMLFERFIEHEPDTEVLQYSLDTGFAQTQALLVQYFSDAALGDTKLEEPDSIPLAKHLPQQQKLDEKSYSSLQRSACGRPKSSLEHQFI